MLSTHRTRVSLALLPVMALLLIGGNATKHLRLTGSWPAKDSTVAEPPREIRLSFNLKPELALVRIGLVSAEDSKVPMGKPVRTADSLTVSAPVLGTLPAGGYTVSWQAASSDGHPLRGTFGFTVASAGAAPAAASPSATTTSRDHSSHH